MIRRNAHSLAILSVCIALYGASAGWARDYDRGGEGAVVPAAFWHSDHERAPVHQHIDARFAHNHYYYDRGYRLPGPPRAGLGIVHGPDHFWYDHGQWYRHDGADWLVVHAPVGVFVPVLPAFYTSIWFGGIPYYYANNTYYIWSAAQNQYEVVDPPAGIEAGATMGAPSSDKVFVYPKNEQSPQQQSTDRYDCYRFAEQQTGYDPTRADGGVPVADAAGKRSDYLRADAACLEGRGYTVR